MNDIEMEKDDGLFAVNFYFKHNTHIVMSMLGGIMVFTFTILYILKPYFTLSDELFFMAALFTASIISFHFYGKYGWLMIKKRIEVTDSELFCYYGNNIVKQFPLSHVNDISVKKKIVFIFPLNTLVIKGNDDEINIVGLKPGSDYESALTHLKGLISEKNPV